MSEELKPCPFCGSHAQTDFIEGRSYIIECYQCEAKTGYCCDDIEAIAAWNRRVPITQDAKDADQRELVTAAWRAGYWDAGYTHDLAYANMKAAEFYDAAMSAESKEAK